LSSTTRRLAVADRVINVITPATDFDLISLDELKIMFGILSTDTSQDEVLALFITNYSDLVATYCNRVFAYEEVSEIWRCVNYDATNVMTRLFLSHYPLDTTAALTLESPTGSVLDPSTYEIESKSGKIELLSTNDEPIKVTYFGGYKLPDEAPPALKQALALMVREGQAMMQRLAVSGIRGIAHKDSRVQYFDYQTTMAKIGLTGVSAIGMSGANTLLMHYVRLEV
jgi:hypothetical protein